MPAATAPPNPGDAPFLQLQEKPESLLAFLGSFDRRGGGVSWTQNEDLDLVLAYWRYLLDPGIKLQDFVRPGHAKGNAVHLRLARLRKQPNMAALLPRTAPPALYNFKGALDMIAKRDATKTERTERKVGSADPADAATPPRSSSSPPATFPPPRAKAPARASTAPRDSGPDFNTSDGDHACDHACDPVDIWDFAADDADEPGALEHDGPAPRASAARRSSSGPFPCLTATPGAAPLHFDYDVWTDLLARPHAGVPTGLEIDAHRGRARIAANFELTVDTRHVLLKLPDFRIVVLELERHTTIDELTRHVRRRLRSTYRSLTNDDGATRAASRTATLAAISRLRLALPDSDGVMRYVAPSTTAEAADLFHRRDLVLFAGLSDKNAGQ